jgi:putative tryptophan/tyrosine transport system substrate-binding protein
MVHPGGNTTGVSLYDFEIYGKRLQLLKEAAPSISKVAWLTPRGTWEATYGQPFQRAFKGAGQRLGISLVPMLLRESTSSEYQQSLPKSQRSSRMRSWSAVRGSDPFP